MGHLSQITAAVYDAAWRELQLDGKTITADDTLPFPFAIHLAVVQEQAEGTVAATANASVPISRVDDPEWDTRIHAHQFAPGTATVFGLAITFRRGDAPGFETFTWAQDIDVTAGDLQEDPET